MTKNFKQLSLILISISIILSACAHKQNGEANNPQQTPVLLTSIEEQVLKNPRAFINEDEKNNASIEIGLIEKSDLGPLEKIRFNFNHAMIRVATTESKKSKGTLLVKKVKGPENCKVRSSLSSVGLVLVEYIPIDLKCRFQIDLTLPQAAEIDLNVSQGLFSVSHWHSPLQIQMNTGEIDFEDIKNINIDCQDCTVSGSGVKGTLKYKLKSGNVGVEGLTNSVDGSTLGDTVLKWDQVIPGTKIILHSKSGDMFLRFPKKTPIALDLKIPKGEFNTNFSPEDIVQNAQEMSFGTPLSIHAETGNVHLIH